MNAKEKWAAGKPWQEPELIILFGNEVRYVPKLRAKKLCDAVCGTRNLLPKNTADPAAIDKD
jgi:hypothetical protein